MQFTSTALLLLAGAISTVRADCAHPSAPPSTGDIALYGDENCSGDYLNVAALGVCNSVPSFDACSAITRPGVRCDIFKTDGCKADYVVTVDETGYRGFCGWFDDTIQSVFCYPA
ncbi:hypothetical protein VTH82DRAFT_3077 [Thermothelomyces myriococcoides]